MDERQGYCHTFYFQAFTDELDVRSSDFQSVLGQGDRLLGQLSEGLDRETLRDQMSDVTDRLARIQTLVAEKKHLVGLRSQGVEEFDAKLQDCQERLHDLKEALQSHVQESPEERKSLEVK